jgi:hypothetical protein
MLAGLLLLPVVYLYLSRFKDTIIDDAYITLQYASTLRDYGHWGFFSDRISNTATSPLNVILTALAGLFTSHIVDAAIGLAALEASALVVVLCLTSRLLFNNYYFGVVSSVGLLTNPLLLSTLGLESFLYTLGLTASIALFAHRQWLPLAVVLALLTLTRPDGCLVFAAMLPFVLWDEDPPNSPSRRPHVPKRRLALMFCGLYVLCLVPWYLFSWISLGSVVADTFFLKVANPWGGLTFARGIPFFLSRYPLETVSSFWLAPLALLAFAAPHRRVRRLMLLLLVFSGLYFAAYASLRVAPYHWYFAPLATSSVLLGALGAAVLRQRYEPSPNVLVRTVFYAVPILAVSGLATFLVQMHTVSPPEAPIHTNWAAPAQYKAIGLWLRDHVDPRDALRMRGEIGTIALYSQRRLVDPFSCREDALWIRHRFDDRGSLAKWLIRLNFYWFQPAGACGPYAYALIGFTRAVREEDLPPGVVQQWSIGSRWVRSGRMVLVGRDVSRRRD